MNSLKIVLCSLCILFLFSCSPKEESYTIDGYIRNVYPEKPYNGYVYLRYANIIDSSEVIDGKFKITGSVEKPINAQIHLSLPGRPRWIFIENSPIKFYGNFQPVKQDEGSYSWLETDSILGSKSQDILNEMGSFFKSNKDNPNIKDDLFKKVLSMSEKYPNQAAFGYILATRSATTKNTLTLEVLKKVLSNVDTASFRKGDVEMIMRAYKLMESTAVGKSLPSFSLPKTDGVRVTNNDLNGKITLVDFWASWCAPCRKKHPLLTQFYTKNKDKNFDVLSISIDQSKESWIKASEQDDLTLWSNVWDKESELKNTLGVDAIPLSILLDENGKIVGKNWSFEQIQDFLDQQ